MSRLQMTVNGHAVDLEVPESRFLSEVLREDLGLTGTKYGCGIGLCGSCMVLVDGEPVQSCLMPAGEMEGREITTIEGLDPDGAHPVQRAWNEVDASCQTGSPRTSCRVGRRR